MRPPRPFGRDGLLSSFDPDEAAGTYLLHRVAGGKLRASDEFRYGAFSDTSPDGLIS